MPRKPKTTSETFDTDETGAPVELFSYVPEDEIPIEVRNPGRRAGKYDALVETAFEQPGSWYRINKAFSSKAGATAVRKRYADYTDEDGNVIYVKAVGAPGNVYFYVKADSPLGGDADV